MGKEHELVLCNLKSLKMIFVRVDQKVLKLTNICTTAKETKEILETNHEGAQNVKDDQDPHLVGDDVEPNAILEVIKIEKVVVERSEILVEESVTLLCW
ncbi:hypothetical protein LIER_17628 [Lithospermum erythrorhizon]|uniref:Uncharacterized protein n=1 Tax=Lithospermum erythrorhizon TaxID=34254 RepID=A0AAV3QF52_LITER